MVNQTALLNKLRVYADNMTEFDLDEMEYLIALVEDDIEFGIIKGADIRND